MYYTYVLQMLQPTVASFHPYPDDRLQPLVQGECLQPVNRSDIKRKHNQLKLPQIFVWHLTPPPTVSMS